MKDELKPCPICGGAAIVDDVSNFFGTTRWSPSCQTEDCLLWSTNYATQREAIIAWNTRTSRTEAEVVAEIVAWLRAKGHSVPIMYANAIQSGAYRKP